MGRSVSVIGRADGSLHMVPTMQVQQRSRQLEAIPLTFIHSGTRKLSAEQEQLALLDAPDTVSVVVRGGQRSQLVIRCAAGSELYVFSEHGI